MSAGRAADGAGRLPGLDLLRALAILWVMLFHQDGLPQPWATLVGYGWIGVDLFFVLSGYLIGWQLIEPYTRGARPQWGQFFLRRAFRIWPAYLAVLVLYFTVPAFRERPGIQPLWQFLTFTENLFPDYFRNQAFSHVWSLCVEEQFYLLLPALVCLLARRAGALRIATVVLVLLLGGMALRSWLWTHAVAPYAALHTGEGNFYQRYIETIYYPIYTRLDGLMGGVVLALVRGFRPAWWRRAMASAPLLLAAGLVLLIAGAALFRNMFGYAGAVFGYPILSVGLALLVLAASSPRTWLGRYHVPGARGVAAMAFSLYLVHKQAFHWMEQQLGERFEDTDLLRLCLMFGAALAAGALLYLLVERPGLLLRKRFLFDAKPEISTAASVTN